MRQKSAECADLPGVRLAHIHPASYDGIMRTLTIPGYNSVLLRSGTFLPYRGTKQGIPVVGFNQLMTDALRTGMKIDARMEASLLTNRTIHRSPGIGSWPRRRRAVGTLTDRSCNMEILP
jgi:hypothetical protein